MTKISPSQRLKLYLILALASLALFFFAVAQVRFVVVDPYDTLGLVSHFPVVYWVGLALLLLASVLAFLDQDLKGDGLFIFLLMALVIFLFGSGVLMYEYPRDPSAYYPTGEVKNLLDTGRFSIQQPGLLLVSYHSWPAFHFLNAFVMLMGGIGLEFIKYAPLFWIPIIGLIAYTMGKRLALSPNWCFLLAFLTLASWMVGYAGSASPRSLGIALFLLLSVLLLTSRGNVAERLLAIPAFGALVITHGYTSVALLAGLTLLLVIRRQNVFTFLLLFVVMFGMWYLYQANQALSLGAHQWWSKPFFDIFNLAQGERYTLASVAARAANRYSQLGYLVLWVSLVAASAVVFVIRWRDREHRNKLLPFFGWSFGMVMMTALNYGGEGTYRLYLFTLLPAATILVLSLAWRPLLVAAMVVTVALSPLNYSGDAGYGQVLASEIKGIEFFTRQVSPPQFSGGYFYGTDPGLMYYYDPNISAEAFNPGFHGPKSPDKVDPAIINPFRWIIISRQATQSIVYGWGRNPYDAWPETPVGRGANLTYDNGGFRIYMNTAYMQFRETGR
ncbi:MAG: hypothetical protein HY673_20425 [Chloroflexi bacterium]|nr:hypothetical protein [Chloroflexota bacterium]